MQDQPKIEFPCDYPIKVVGTLHAQFESDVLEVVGRHAEQTDRQPTMNVSRRGNYGSLTVSIVATGPAQLKRLHRDLMNLDAVRMVL